MRITLKSFNVLYEGLRIDRTADPVYKTELITGQFVYPRFYSPENLNISKANERKEKNGRLVFWRRCLSLSAAYQLLISPIDCIESKNSTVHTYAYLSLAL